MFSPPPVILLAGLKSQGSAFQQALHPHSLLWPLSPAFPPAQTLGDACSGCFLESAHPEATDDLLILKIQILALILRLWLFSGG